MDAESAIEPRPFATLVHISDVHVRLLARHDEFRHVFAHLRTLLQHVKATGTSDVLLVVTGDVFHTKVELTPESLLLAYDFFDMLGAEAPTLVIAGNHDALLCNPDREDNLSAVFARCRHPNVTFLRDSGIFPFRNLDIHVFSVLGTPDAWPTREQSSKTRCAVALFHGAVGRYQCSRQTMAFSTEASMSMKQRLMPYDMVLLGDIHQWQFLAPHMAYAGSLVAQNEGERDSAHGVLLWDVATRTAVFAPVWNDYAYVLCTVQSDDHVDLWDGTRMPTHDWIQKGRMPVYGRCSLVVRDRRVPADDLRVALRRRFPNMSVKILRDEATEIRPDDSIDSLTNTAMTDGSTRTVDAEAILHAYWSENVTQQIGYATWREEMLQHWKTVTESIHHREESARLWQIQHVQAANVFGYGELDWVWSQTGVFVLTGANSAGKSTLVDVLTLLLFGKCARWSHGVSIPSEVVRHGQSRATGRVVVQVGGHQLVITRTFVRHPSTLRIKMDVHVTVDGVNRTGRERRETDQFLQRFLGTMEDFTFLSCCMQVRQRGFCDMSQKERKEFLFEHFSLHRWDIVHQTALAAHKHRQQLLAIEKAAHDTPEADIRAEVTTLAHELHASQDVVTTLEQEHTALLETIHLTTVSHMPTPTPVDAFFDTSEWRAACPQLILEQDDLEQASVELDEVSAWQREWVTLRHRRLARSSTEDPEMPPPHLQFVKTAATDDLPANVRAALPPLSCDTAVVERHRAACTAWLEEGERARTRHAALTEALQTWQQARQAEEEACERQLQQETVALVATTSLSGKRWADMRVDELRAREQEVEEMLAAVDVSANDRIDDMESLREAEGIRDTIHAHARAVTDLGAQCDRLLAEEEQVRADAPTTVWYDVDRCEACRTNPHRLEQCRRVEWATSLRERRLALCREMHRRWTLVQAAARKMMVDDGVDGDVDGDDHVVKDDHAALECAVAALHEAVQRVVSHLQLHAERQSCAQALRVRERQEALRAIRQRVFPEAAALATCAQQVSVVNKWCALVQHAWALWDAWAAEQASARRRRDVDAARETWLRQRLCAYERAWRAERRERERAREAWCAEQRARLQSVHERLTAQRAACAVLERRLADAEDRYRRACARGERIAAMTDELDLSARVVKTLHRDGLPSFLLRRQLTVLTTDWNDILRSFLDKRVSLSMQQDDVVWSILHPDGTVQHPAFLGGMETFLMDVALKLVFHQRSCVPKTSFFVIDEGVSQMDKTHLSDLSRLTDFLRTHFATSWIVTHVERVRDFVDGEHRVVRDGGVSTLLLHA